MKMNTFEELFVHKMQSLYDMENQIIESMPTLLDMCSSQGLKDALQKHLQETEKQKEKLEVLANDLNIELEGPSNLAMEGMIDETMEMIQDNQKSPLMDAALIAAAQAVEHHEIACYGTAAEWAEKLGFDEAKKVLAEIMDEEKASDETLSKLAVETINQQAKDVSGQIAMGRTG